jgi:F0F1-type ATP synthase delta subunit
MAPSITDQKPDTLQFPVAVATKVDVGRLLREVEQIDSFLKQSAIRTPGSPTKMPKTSRLCDEMIEMNKLNMLHDDERARLHHFLTEVKANAPVMHISFSADPSPLFTQKLVTWLRSEIHPFVLLQIGLQPNMGAGCVVRTTNKYFDFSLRDRFKSKGDILAKLLNGATE